MTRSTPATPLEPATPVELPDEPDLEPTEPTETDLMEPTPERSLIIQMQFSDGTAADPTTYATKLDRPDTFTAEQYAKEVAERVERTVLLHLGALPVLAKVEATA